MMIHNITFGNKMFVGLEHVILTHINSLTLRCDLDPEYSSHFSSQDTVAYDDVSSDQFWSPRNQQFRKYTRKSHILIIWAPRCDLDLEDSNYNNNNPHDTLAHDAA